MMVTLGLLDGTYGIARLDPGEEVPGWVAGPGFVSVTRTDDELSIVCPDGRIPVSVTAERRWRLFRVAGKLDFSLTGIVHSLTGPLADAEIGVFVVSTYDTDYLAVQEADHRRAAERLRQAGHGVDSGQV